MIKMAGERDICIHCEWKRMEKVKIALSSRVKLIHWYLFCVSLAQIKAVNT